MCRYHMNSNKYTSAGIHDTCETTELCWRQLLNIIIPQYLIKNTVTQVLRNVATVDLEEVILLLFVDLQLAEYIYDLVVCQFMLAAIIVKNLLPIATTREIKDPANRHDPSVLQSLNPRQKEQSEKIWTMLPRTHKNDKTY